MINKGRTSMRMFSGDNLDRVYKKITTFIMKEGLDITFGDKNEPKSARDTLIVVQLYGKGLNDCLKGKVPKGFGWGGSKLVALMMSFFDRNTNPHGHVYTYPQQMKEYNDSHLGKIYDQMQHAKERLAVDVRDDIFSNRNVGVIYHPVFWDNPNMPCFNWFQVRYMGDNKASVRLLFRSHDYGTGLFANASSIGHAFEEQVLKPNDCEMSELIIISASAHVYENNSQMIEELTGISW